MFSLFWSVWANPDTRIYSIVKYLLMMSDESSLTWAAHLRITCKLYNLDPLLLLNSKLCPCEKWKALYKVRVTAFYESLRCDKALNYPKMTFLNVKAIGVTGRPHPTLHSIFNITLKRCANLGSTLRCLVGTTHVRPI